MKGMKGMKFFFPMEKHFVEKCVGMLAIVCKCGIFANCIVEYIK